MSESPPNADGLRKAAEKLLAAGFCALPAKRAEKRPAVASWKKYQSRPPEPMELETLFSTACDGVCLVAGAVSGNLELIDFDQAGELFDAWSSTIPKELYARLAIELSQSGGRHVVYRCEMEVGGSLKLAQRCTDGNVVTLIETRGEGGLFLCAPTPGYELIQGDLADLPVLFGRRARELARGGLGTKRILAPSVAHVALCGNVWRRGVPWRYLSPGRRF